MPCDSLTVSNQFDAEEVKIDFWQWSYCDNGNERLIKTEEKSQISLVKMIDCFSPFLICIFSEFGYLPYGYYEEIIFRK